MGSLADLRQCGCCTCKYLSNINSNVDCRVGSMALVLKPVGEKHNSLNSSKASKLPVRQVFRRIFYAGRDCDVVVTTTMIALS